MSWQRGYSRPPAHMLHSQMVPFSYQQASDASEHGPVAALGVAGHAAGSGGMVAQLAGGCVTDQEPFEQIAVTRHVGRGSSPQLQ